MAELKLLTSGELFSHSCYLQITTDQLNLDNYIGIDFPLLVPTTFHVMKPKFVPFPRLNIATFRPPTCFLAFLVFASGDKFESNHENDFKSSLGMATQSVKTFINLYNYTKIENVPHSPIPWLKERLNIFWFTTEKVIGSPELFPRNDFFVQYPITEKEPFYMYTTLFMIQVQSVNSSLKPKTLELLFVCLHCTFVDKTDNPDYSNIYIKMANISLLPNPDIVWTSTAEQSKQSKASNFLTHLHRSIATLAPPVAVYGGWTEFTKICQRGTFGKGSGMDGWYPLVKMLCGANVTVSIRRPNSRSTYPGMTSEFEISLG